jgi:hypothetical protein
MFEWVLKLKAWAIELALLAFAILSGLVWERHKGKIEGAQIAAGQSAKEIEHAATVSANETAKAQQLAPGEAQKELQKDWSRD